MAVFTTVPRLAAAGALILAAGCNTGNEPTRPVAFIGPAEMVVTDLRLGAGEAVVAGQTVDVVFSLWLYDPRAAEFKGVPAGAGRAELTLTPDQIIQGFVEGLPGMRVGGLRRLVIPPSLGFGTTGSTDGRIPPNAWTVFDVELLAIVE